MSELAEDSGIQLDAAWAQILGTRETQQDSACITRWDNGFHLLLLADGMGGHRGGAEASQLVLTAMREAFVESQQTDLPERLLASLQAANNQLDQYLAQHPDMEGMGTTLLAACVDQDHLYWISVGDSPMWLVRQGRMRRLNANHSMAAVLDEQLAAGKVSAEQAADPKARAQLLEAVMGDSIELIDLPRSPLQLQADDRLLLASDGIESLPPETMEELLKRLALVDATTQVDHLLNAVSALERPYQDNTSLILLRVLTEHNTTGQQPS
ncbi:hypothetical protein CK507_01270 [Pseudomonas sp. WN033]|nr:hypothetical protein CK507_01270 [Pseudomonas sp. WN033]